MPRDQWPLSHPKTDQGGSEAEFSHPHHTARSSSPHHPAPRRIQSALDTPHAYVGIDNTDISSPVPIRPQTLAGWPEEIATISTEWLTRNLCIYLPLYLIIIVKSYTMDQQYSKLLKTAHAIIKGYELWDIDAIMAPRASNCTYYTLPTSLNRPKMNNEEYRQYYTGMVMPYLKDFRVTIFDTCVDAKTNQVVLYAKSNAETVVGAYEAEQTVMLKMTEDGEKVWEVKEFFDSAQIQSVFVELAKYIENGGKPINETT